VITVVDYGMGNLRNVRRAFETQGHRVEVTSDRESIGRAERLVLPGVGAFGEAVRRIDGLGIREALLRHGESGRPLLGICLGMQLLFELSEESPGAHGLGMLPGSIVKFTAGVKVPHIGWNDVQPLQGAPLFVSGGEPVCCYFVHSYHARQGTATTALTTYGVEFAAAIARGNVFGVQFHPEKSQSAGLAILDRFARL
jgi:glutamine amidotransferase